MKILVTGGAGFIGSNVADGYIAAGHEVVIVDDLSTGRRTNVHDKAIFYEVDIRSEDILEILKRERPETVNHHAAQISVPKSVSDPRLDADINLLGILNLLEASVKTGVRKMIFISSGGAIYGDAEEYPTSETYTPKPLSPYAVSKFASEHYLAYYRHQYGLDYSVLRYANVYGPRQIPHGEAGVVAIFMDNLVERRSSTVNHFPGEEEGMVRDYCYVGDVVTANLKALTKGEGEVINIGTGVETRTLALYGIICGTYRAEVPDLPRELDNPVFQEARPGDIPRSCLNVRKAAEVLGWSPETPISEGIGLTLGWRLGQIP